MVVRSLAGCGRVMLRRCCGCGGPLSSKSTSWHRSGVGVAADARESTFFFHRFPNSRNFGVGAESPISEESLKESQKGKPLRILSGIQPTGQIHLGNYFGAVQQWTRFQEQKTLGLYEQCIFSVVDLHAITLPQDRDDLEKATFEAVATLLACGIDPNQSVLFLQSHVAYHSQLAWVLGCMTTMPRLSQLPQYKEKSKKMKEIPLGLFTYPVLQSADILLYNATHIPIGEDNIQHIQLVQHTAQRFNRIYGDTFVIPKSIIVDGMASRLRSLRKPENKMSKSEPDPKSRISLSDSPEEIVEKIKKAVTDFNSEVTYDPTTRPGVSNLIVIHSLCANKPVEEICLEAQGMDTGEYKKLVADSLIEHLKPIRTRLLDLLQDRSYLLSVLKLGAGKAKDLAKPTWDLVCYNTGIAPKLSWLSRVPNKAAKVASK